MCMDRKQVFVVALLVLAITLPFLGKPFHIDDTVVLHVTENILKSFWDPFAGQIDWFGYELDLWKATTNPPFLSYYLAPFALLSNYSEIALHLAMLAFFLLLALSMQVLSQRFVGPGYWPLLFLMTSVAVVVSGNVMRDIPGTALGAGGVACFVWGSDRDRREFLILGALLAGLAVLTKYSAAVVLPVMALYAVVRGRFRHLFWLSVAAAIVALWSLHNYLVYGQPHMLYLFLERRSSSSILWQDKFFGALTVLGSSLLLLPALLVQAVRRRRWLLLSSIFLLGLATAGWIRSFSDTELDLELLGWAGMGFLALSIALFGGPGWRSFDRDSLFLAVWLGGVVLFSVLLVPFQAVRHLLPALPPMLLLSFRFLHNSQPASRWRPKRILGVCLVMQVGLAMAVHLADYEYAASYRDFAESVKDGGESIWYVGHWGWKFYADRSGFRQLHRDGPDPVEGDVLLWPEKVHIGRVFENDRGLRDRLELISNKVYEGSIPIRTMDWVSGAGFYSVGRGILPYRFFPEGPVEVMRIYRVKGKQHSP